MQDQYGHGHFEEPLGHKSAREFEEKIRSRDFYFIDLLKVDEIFHYYLDQNDLVKAQHLVNFARQSHPACADLDLKMAIIELEQGNCNFALQCVNEALEKSPMHFECCLLKAEILAQLDRYDEAIKLLRHLRAVAPSSEEVLLQMGNVAQLCGHTVHSEQYYREALQEAPNFVEAVYELAFLLESLSRHEEGIKIYEAFLNEHPYTADIWYQLGILYARVEQYEKAIEAFDFATVVKDDFGQAFYKKGRTLLYLDRPQEALKAFLEAATSQPKDVHTLYYIGQTYRDLQVPKDAIRYFHYVGKIDPDYADAWLGIGYCLEKGQKYLEAVHYFQKAFRLDEENEEICFAIASCEFRLGNRFSALEYLQYALDIKPDAVFIWNGWAAILAEEQGVRAAADFLEEGIKRNPKNSAIYYLAAAYAYKAGFEEKAIGNFQNGLLLDHSYHELFFRYAPEARKDPMIMDLVTRYSY